MSKQRTTIKARAHVVDKVRKAMPDICKLKGRLVNNSDCYTQVLTWGLERMKQVQKALQKGISNV